MSSNNYPQRYDFDEYVKWHEAKIPEDYPLITNLTTFREKIKSEYMDYFSQLGQLLSQIQTHCSKEIKVQYQNIIKGDYEIPFNVFTSKISSNIYDSLYKSNKSIINKLWRLNAKQPNKLVSLNNIKSFVKDLARTSVICPSLLYAEFFSNRLKKWDTIIEKDNREKHISNINKVKIEDEVKLASGYFAYHSYIYFDDSNVIEVQLFSQLSSVWRDLSHLIYEKSRIGITEPEGFGKTKTRLTSLGHLLHIAECEIERLHKEILHVN